MKKIILSVVSAALSLIIAFCLCGCEPPHYFFNYDELKEGLMTIELINYDLSDLKFVENIDEVLPFDFDKMTAIEKLETEKTEDFLNSLTEIEFHLYGKFPNSVAGKCVKITYDNEDFLIIFGYSGMPISHTLYGDIPTFYSGAMQFNSEGKIKKIVDAISWNGYFTNLVNDYFQTQI